MTTRAPTFVRRSPARALRALAMVLALVTAASCGEDLGFSPMSERLRLSVARDRWLDHAPRDYQFTMQRICFCIDIPEMRVIVVDGAVVSVRPVGGGEELTGFDRGRFLPIVDLFALLLEGIERPAYAVHAEYDPSLGFPADVFIDYERNIADEEYGFRVRDVIFPTLATNARAATP